MNLDFLQALFSTLQGLKQRFIYRTGFCILSNLAKTVKTDSQITNNRQHTIYNRLLKA